MENSRTVAVKTGEPQGIAPDLPVCLHCIQGERCAQPERRVEELRHSEGAERRFGHQIRTPPLRGVLSTLSRGKSLGEATYRSSP